MAKKKKDILDTKKYAAKLIVNPGAGDGNNFNARLEQATRCLLDHGIRVDVALAKPKRQATPIARKAARDGYKIVIAMGGDGTIEAVMRGLVGTKVHLGIIPAGTANNIAIGLGIPQELAAACDLIASGHFCRMDMGRLKTKKKTFYFFELAAVGLTAALYPEAKKIPKGGGLASIKEAAATLLGYQTPKVSLTLNGESQVELESLLVTVANTPSWGLNFLVAPNASLEDGLLDVCIYPDFSKAQLLAYFASIRNATPDNNTAVQRYQVRKLKIKAAPKQDLMADGVMLGCRTAKIKVLPGALRIIVPTGTPGLAQEPQKDAAQVVIGENKPEASSQ